MKVLEGDITDTHSDDRVDSIYMNEMFDLEDRRDDILKKSPHLQVWGFFFLVCLFSAE
jgi:hypothetical protein